MKIEDQVCSLELAKRLKELGVKQESLFYWNRTDHVDKQYSVHIGILITNTSKEAVSAFSVAELGEMLALSCSRREVKFNLSSNKHDKNNYWVCYWVDLDKEPLESKMHFGENEADARAKMLIWLTENGHVKNEN